MTNENRTISNLHFPRTSPTSPMYQNPDEDSWVFNPTIRLDHEGNSAEDPLQSKDLLLFALDSSQDGVSILDVDMQVHYMNTSIKLWYSIAGEYIGQKCYQVYHNRLDVCENCPIQLTIENKMPYMGIVKYSQHGFDKGWQQLFAIPILDRHNNLIGVLEYVRDITHQYQLEHDLNMIMEQFQSLENRNAAISQLLAERKQEREQLEETISMNVEKFIRPSLNFLKARSNINDVNLVETLIDEIVYPMTKKRSSIFDRLTSRELEIAQQIKDGKTSNEIATSLKVTIKTIDFHRANIRKKLGIQAENGEYINLRAYLSSHL